LSKYFNSILLKFLLKNKELQIENCRTVFLTVCLSGTYDTLHNVIWVLLQVAGSSTPMLVLLAEIYKKEGLLALYNGLGTGKEIRLETRRLWLFVVFRSSPN
jgi:hypothetical protein